MKKMPTITQLLQKLRQPGVLASFARGAGIAFILQIMTAALGYLLQVCLARVMAHEDYGLYTYLLAWATILSIVSGLGLRAGVLRFIPQYNTQRDWGRLQGVIRGSWQITLVASLIMSLLATLLVLLINASKGVENLTPVLLGIWLIPLLALEGLQLNLFRAARQMASAYAPSGVIRPLLLMGGALGLFLWQGNQPIASTPIFIITIVTLFISLGSQGLLRQRGLLAQGKGEKPIYEIRTWLRVSLPLLLITGFIIILYQADLLMLGAFKGPAEVGLYNAATKTANLASFLFSAVEAIGAPMIASLYAEGNRKDLQKLVSTMAHLVFWPSLALTLCLSVFAEPILSLFGPEFVAARWALITLALGQLVNATTGPVGYLLDLTGHQDQSARVRCSTAFINIALNAILIPKLGIMGAALATAIAVSVDNIWIYFLAVKNVGVHASIFSFLTLRFQKGS